MNTPVIDFHSHAASWGRHGMHDDLERYIQIMDAAGIDRACINCIFFGDARRGNDTVARIVDQYPDRFIPVAFATPHYPEEAIGELEHAFDDIGAKFLKIYPPYFGRSIDDPGYFPIFEWCNDRGAAVMSHSVSRWDPPTVTIEGRFTALAQRFPNVKWVLAHDGGGGPSQDDAIAAAHAVPTVYLETATDWDAYGDFEHIVEGAGADRVLFGSDMSLFDARLEVGKIATAAISDEAKQMILGLNAIKLLGLEL